MRYISSATDHTDIRTIIETDDPCKITKEVAEELQVDRSTVIQQ